LLAALLIFTYAAVMEPVNGRLLLASVVGLVTLSPIHTPMLVVALVCLFWLAPRRTGAVNARLLGTATVMAVLVSSSCICSRGL